MSPGPARVGSSRHGVAFWIAAMVGGGVMVFGFIGLVGDQSGDRVANWLAFLVGLDLLHDAVLAPAVCGVGVLLARALPGSWRGPVQAGLFATAVILLVAAAPLAGTADFVGNPTIQPLDYRTSTLTAVAVAWVAVVACTVLSRRLGRKRRSRTSASQTP